MYKLRILRYARRDVIYYLLMTIVSVAVVYVSYDNIVSGARDNNSLLFSFAVVCGYIVAIYVTCGWHQMLSTSRRSLPVWVEVISLTDGHDYLTGYADIGMPYERIKLSDIETLADDTFSRDGIDYRYIVATVAKRPDINHLTHYASWMDDPILFGLYSQGDIPVVCLPYATIADKLQWWYVSKRLYCWWHRHAQYIML